jgi:beta-lactamase regulating signal transducer with metallopeptidase domain
MTAPGLQSVISQSWQIAALAVVVAVIAAFAGRRRPHLAYLLWMLVLVKALTPPLWASSWGVFSHLQTERPTVVVESDTPANSTSAPAFDVPTITPSTSTSPQLAPAPSLAAPASNVDWRILLAAIWLAGSLCFAVAIVAAYRRWWRRVEQASVPVDASVIALFDQLSTDLGLRRRPRLLAVTLPTGPVAGGILTPTVVIPASAAELPAADLKPILAHELVHLRRLDPLAALLQWLAVAVWWWHPAVWFASRCLSGDRERCCDAEVLGSLRLPPDAYAQSLIDVLRRRVTVARLPVPLTIPLASPTRKRLEHIMRSQRFAPRPPRRHFLIAALLALLVLPGGALLTPVVSQDNPAPVESGNTLDLKFDDAVFISDNTSSPRLRYLTWQIGDEGSGAATPHTLWRPDGTPVDDAEAAEVLKEAGTFQAHWSRIDELRPLVLVYDADTAQENFSVQSSVVAPGGQRSAMGTWAFNRGKDLAASAAVFRVPEIAQWPETVSIEARYPLSNWQLIKTESLTTPRKLEIADGVTCYFDPRYDHEQVAGRTTGVLQVSPDVDPLVEYDVRVFLHGLTRPTDYIPNGGATAKTIDGKTYSIRFTRPFEQSQIERVEVYRRQYATSRIDNVRLDLDLLAKVEGNIAPADRQALLQFHKDYGLDQTDAFGAVPEASVRRIAPPFPASRMAFYRVKHAEQAMHIPAGPDNIMFRWLNDRPALQHMWFGSELQQLLSALVGVGPDRIQGDQNLLRTHVTGDFCLRAGAAREQIIKDLEPILSEALNRPVTLSLAKRPTDVYVATGKFQLSKAAQDRGFVLMENALVGAGNSVADAIERAKQAPRPNFPGFLDSIAACTGVPIVNEVEAPPAERIFYESVLGRDVRTSYDPTPLINSVSEQTGLTFKKERRNIQMLTVE